MLSRSFILAFLLLLAACGSTPTPPSLPSRPAPSSPPSTGAPSPSPAPTAPPFTVALTPNAAKNFRGVVGRVPFTVTFRADVSSDRAPYTFAWDFNGDGKTDSAAAAPPPYVFTQPNAYTATVTVRASDGSSQVASQRIVAYAPPTLPAFKYGVTAPLDRRDPRYYPTLADVAHAADVMRDAGIQAVRVEFNWDALEPAQGKFNFDDQDAMVQTVRARDLEILGLLDYSSWWASSAQDSNDWRVRLFSPPTDPETYARYVYETVKHYHDTVHVWELWNEPNIEGFWKPHPDPAKYVQLLQAAYRAVKYADPNAVVVFGGVSSNGVEGNAYAGMPENFLPQAYAAGAHNFFDVMAIHPYILPNSGIDALRAKISATRDVMNQNGDAALPIWLTEIGVPDTVPWWSNAPLQNQDDVAAWLSQVYTRLWDLTPAIFWHTLNDHSTGDPVEQRFGLLNVDNSPKPAYEKYRELTQDQ